MRDSRVVNMSQPEPRVVLTNLDTEQECLSELSDTAEKLLKFRLHEDTEGIWVCCDLCGRWRYLPDHQDLAFFCERSFRCADAEKICNVGYDDRGSDLVFYETKFCAGSLVWAKRPDGPNKKDWIWWPALVEDSPDSVSQYFLLKGSSNIPIAYHVCYLDAYRTSGWISADLIKPFDQSARDLFKFHDTRGGKRQSSLRAAVERAIIASTYDLEGRLEKFSYIAHMARLKGSITAGKTPVYKILNGTEEAQATSTGSKLARDGVNETRRPRKRMLDKNRDEISNKKAKADASLTGKIRAAGKRLSREKTDTENQLESSGKADSQISDDSGYVIHEKSPNESSAHNIESRAATKVAQSGGDSKKPSRLKGPSFQDEGFESQDFGSSVDEPKKRGLDKKLEGNESSQNEGGAKIPRKNTEGSVKKFQSTSGGSLESLESKNLARKQVQLKHSSLESSTKISSKKETASTKKVSFESDSVDSESIRVNQDSRTEEINGLLPTSIETPPVSEQNSEMVDYDSESNTLEATSNLKVVRKRRAKKEDTLTASNGLPESTGFSQPPRQVGSADSRKRTGTNRRQETVGSAGTTPSFSMSQPAPSRNRGKFAPPTKARAEGVNYTNYTFDDFYRNLTDGVI